MSYIAEFLGISPGEITPESELRRTIRNISIRSTHTGTLPGWSPSDPKTQDLVELLTAHKIDVIDSDNTRIVTRYRTGREHTGREYTFQWDGSRWNYTVSYDPVSGLDVMKKDKVRKGTIYDDLDNSSRRAPSCIWWNGKDRLEGKFLSFDLEGSHARPGEFSAIALASAATETGEGVLLRPNQILPFLLTQHKKHPKQIWCGWNIAGFDIPVFDYRIPRFREEMHDILMERLCKGLLYDTMLFVQLYDIGLYGDMYAHESTWLYPVGWSGGKEQGVYTLAAQARRWLGVDISKAEQASFWEYLDNPEDISEDQAAYALGDSLVCAAIQERVYNHPNVWKMAAIAKKEIDQFDGTKLVRDEGCDKLVMACGTKFGWQTHTTQFIGAYSLSWISANGIEVDIEYIFSLIETLSDEVQRLFRRLGGEPGYPIIRVNKIKGNKEECGWVSENEDAIAFIDDLVEKDRAAGKEAEFEYETQPLEILKFLRHREDNSFYSTYKKKKGTFYVFCEDGSAKKKEIEEYTFEYILDKTPDAYFKTRGMRSRDDASRLGLKQKDWMYFYDVSRVEDIPDPVLRLNFQIATLLKKIATLKTYLPGLCEQGSKKANALKKEDLINLRRKLNLTNQSTGRIHPSFRSLLATGRTGAKDPNTQQVERNNKFRNSFLAARGYKFMSADYGAAEMGTQAEIFVHRYKMEVLAQYINDGFDIHLLTGMQFQFPDKKEIWMPILSHTLVRDLKRVIGVENKLNLAQKAKDIWPWFGIKPNDSGEDMAKDIWVRLLAESLLPDKELPIALAEIKEARQAAKPINFGVPGGMNPPRIQVLAKTDYGLSLSRKEAEKAYNAWLTIFPEGKLWLEDGTEYLVKDPPFPYLPFYRNCVTLTGRLRGYRVAVLNSGYDTGRNEWHNAQFQGLAADGAKIALYLTWREGLRQVNFVHDEIDFEVPEELATEHQELATNRMRLGMGNVVKYVTITVGSGITSKWKK